ncbi:MAG: hypothetical protein ACOC9N_01660 [Gemmatimonadota bacterium]
MSEPPPRPSVRSLLFLVVLGAQLLVPFLQFMGPRPARFGWQMFAGARPVPVFVVERADGTADTVDLSDHLANHRPEMELATELPPGLCRRVAGAERVRVRIPRITSDSIGAAVADSTAEYLCP